MIWDHSTSHPLMDLQLMERMSKLPSPIGGNSPKTPTLVTAGIVLIVLGAAIGCITGSKTNDLVTVEVAEAEVQRPPESEQHSVP